MSSEVDLDGCSLHIFSPALDEGEFWEWVFNNVLPTDPVVGWEPDDGDDDWYDPIVPAQSVRCPECGEYGACGYDALGRPMIHSTSTDDRDDLHAT